MDQYQKYQRSQRQRPDSVFQGGRTGGDLGYQMGVMDGSGEVFLQFNESGQSWPGWVLRGGKVPLNKWTFIAGTYDNNTMAIYVNGVPTVSRMNGLKRVANSSSNLRLSLDDNANGEVSGMLDEMRIYNYALSAEEIRKLYSEAGDIPIPKPTTVVVGPG